MRKWQEEFIVELRTCKMSKLMEIINDIFDRKITKSVVKRRWMFKYALFELQERLLCLVSIEWNIFSKTEWDGINKDFFEIDMKIKNKEIPVDDAWKYQL